MTGKIIWPLIAAALLLGAALGGIWFSGVLDPPSAPPADRDPASPPRALAPVAMRITADGGQGPFKLSVGEELQLRAAVELEDGSIREDAPIDWASSAPQIATVNREGILRARSVGEAILEAHLAPLTAQAVFSIAH